MNQSPVQTILDALHALEQLTSPQEVEAAVTALSDIERIVDEITNYVTCSYCGERVEKNHVAIAEHIGKCDKRPELAMTQRAIQVETKLWKFIRHMLSTGHVPGGNDVGCEVCYEILASSSKIGDLE